jgi:hypothetical protein
LKYSKPIFVTFMGLANSSGARQKGMIPEGIEPPIFGTGIRRVAIAPWNHSLEHLTTHRHSKSDFAAVVIVNKQKGAIRESNPRPPAPKAGIIPLDQSPDSLSKNCTLWDSNPRPQRGSELESDALTNSAKGALLMVWFAALSL